MAFRIYTRGGDKGTTGLVGGSRVNKDDIRIEANGTIDEVSSGIGYLRALLGHEHPWQEGLHKIQTDLMDIMSHVATPSTSKVQPNAPHPEAHIAVMEQWIDTLEDNMKEPSRYFILPGGNTVSAWCHVLRTVTRRAERRVITLHHADPLPNYIPQYFNRLSDLLFAMARAEMDHAQLDEEQVKPFRPGKNSKA